MANIFEQTIVPKIPFSNFDLSEAQIITHNFGQLIPCYVKEVLPNDVFKLSAYADVEFAPMVAAMKQDVHLSIHFFYCPDRILFDKFETFITGAEDGHPLTTEAELTRMPLQPGWRAKYTDDMFSDIGQLQGSLLDYLGLPNELQEIDGLNDDFGDTIISDFPLRAYFKIWYDYYRDENLQYEFKVGVNTYTYYDFWRFWYQHDQAFDKVVNSEFCSELKAVFGGQMLPFYRAFKKDYMTAALPSPQKGEPVTISLGGEAPVKLKQAVTEMSIDSSSILLNPRLNPSGHNGTLGVTANPSVGASNIVWNNNDPDNPDQGVVTSMTSDNKIIIGDPENSVKFFDEDSELVSNAMYVNLATATAVTVEQLREAFAVQEILESLSLRGSRYTEFLRGNFGVTPDDYKLQRPQFLGGLVTPVAVQKVIQTSGYSGADNRDMTGYAAGRAFAACGDRVFKQRFKEHGYIIGIMSVMPKAYYYQGVPRHFMRRDRFDYYMVQTAHLGEQAIENCELYLNTDTKNHDVFGFIPRWAEYKTTMNGIHGDFRGNLAYYHMARVFSGRPTLSENFILTKNVQTRPFAVWKAENPNINHLIWTSLFFKVTASRPIPYHSVPKVQ